MTLNQRCGLRPIARAAYRLSPHSSQAWPLFLAPLLNPYPKHHPLRHSTTTAVRITHHPRLNPPSSTLPPPLVLPTRSSSQSAFSYYFSLGKAYLTFYKTGLKAVFTNHRSAQSLKAARIPPGKSVDEALYDGLLSRAEWQTIGRSWHDLIRLPVFALVLAVCGEFTPLVVPFMGGMLPRTCRIPSQVSGTRQKVEERRRRSFRGGMTLEGKGGGAVKGIDDLHRDGLLHIGRSLGLYSQWWDRLAEMGLGGVPTLLIRQRVERRVAYFDADDFAIKRDGAVDLMEMEEVRIALEERGLDVLERNDTQLRQLLRSWLQARTVEPTTILLLTRPSVWRKGSK